MASKLLKREIEKEFSALQKNKKSAPNSNRRRKKGGVKSGKFSFLDPKQFDTNLNDKTEENLKALLATVETTTNEDVFRAVIEQDRKTKRQVKRESTQEKKEDAGTLFTEEDFENFAKSYFINSKPTPKSDD